MEDRRKHIDDLFREGLGDYRESPGPGVWDALEQRLPAADTAVTARPFKNWLWYLLLLMLLATVGYFIIKKTSEHTTGERKLNENTVLPANPADISSTPPVENAAQEAKDNHDAERNDLTPNSHPADNTEGTSTTGAGEDQAKKETGEDNQRINIRQEKEENNNDKAGWKDNARTSGTASTGTTGTSTSAADKAINPGLKPSGRNNAGNSVARSLPANTSIKTSSKKNRETTAEDQSPHKKEPEERTTGTTPYKVDGKKNTYKNPENQDHNNQKDAATQDNIPQPGPSSGKTAIAKAGNSKKNTAPGINNSNRQDGAKQRNKVKADESLAANNSGNKPTPTSREQTTIAKQNIQNSDPREKPARSPKTAGKPVISRGKEVPVKTGTVAASIVNRTKNNETASGKAVRKDAEPVQPETAGAKDISVTSATGHKKGLQVNPATFDKKEISAPTAASFKKSKIVVNSSEPKARIKQKDIIQGQPKKSYEVTSNGIKLKTSEDEEEIKEEKTAPVQQEKQVEKTTNNSTVEEVTETPAKVLLATGTNPTPVVTPAPGGGGAGGGGAQEPRSPLRNFNKLNWEGGIKAGYEQGFGNVTTRSYVFAPFLQWNISSRVSLSIQPGFRYNQISRTDIFDMTKSFYRITQASRDSAHITIQDSLQIKDSLQRNYIYRNIYDSVIFGYQVKEKNYWEIELPIFLRYRFSNKFSAFIGPYLTFGNLIKVTADEQTVTGLQRLDTLSYAPVVVDTAQGAAYPNPAPPGIANYFNYNTDPYDADNPGNAPNPATNPARFGLMFGFSYELRNRIIIDMMMKQNISDMRYIKNEEVRKIYTQPYFRIMVGVKLFDSEKKKVVNPGGL